VPSTVPVSSVSPSPALLVASWYLGPCQVGAPRPMEALNEHLPAGRPIAGRLRPRRAARFHFALRVMWTSTWSVHALRFGPHRARQHPLARAHVLEQSGRRLATDEPCHGTRSERAPGRACRSVPCGPVSLAVGHASPGLFGSMARPRQAERALCIWATLGFWPSGRFKLENPFSIFFSVLV
jgi:hypothetical protein